VNNDKVDNSSSLKNNIMFYCRDGIRKARLV